VPELAAILAKGYLRLLQHHGSDCRERWQLREKTEESSRNSSIRLDFRRDRSIRCAGKRTVTLTLTRS